MHVCACHHHQYYKLTVTPALVSCDHCLLQYAIKIKHDEINKLKEVSRTEYAKLQEQGGQLVRDTTLLENFLKENERAAVEAIK